jgi:hypothetical protein
MSKAKTWKELYQIISTCKKFGDLANGSSWKPDFLPLTVEFKAFFGSAKKERIEENNWHSS